MNGKSSSLTSKEPLLLRLRAGEVRLGEVISELRPILKVRATYFWKRWEKKQTLLTPDDLVTHMELALGRAVDTWDPSRRALIVYVDYQLGRAAEKALRKAAGYPDERRVKPLARPVYVEDFVAKLAKSKNGNEPGRLDNPLDRLVSSYGGRVTDMTQEDALIQREHRTARVAAVLNKLEEGYTRKVVELVLSGYTVQGAADALYAARRPRGYYGLASQGHARRAAYVAVTYARRVSERVAAV